MRVTLRIIIDGVMGLRDVDFSEIPAVGWRLVGFAPSAPGSAPTVLAVVGIVVDGTGIVLADCASEAPVHSREPSDWPEEWTWTEPPKG